MAARADEPCIDIQSLPDISLASMDFRDTSFFQTGGESSATRSLPTPDEIGLLSPTVQGGGRDIVRFDHLNLVVKAGPSDHLGLEEAQVMWALRKAFPAQEVPVPELFGWRKVGRQNFIYMSLIPGLTLYEAWPSLTNADKASIQTQLASIVSSLRQLSQGAGHSRFIGSINGGFVQDRLFRVDFEGGPFWSIPTFNNFAAAAALRLPPDSKLLEKNIYRDFFSDSGDIYFTHGDLHPTNIMVSTEGVPQITGIIDWEQAGWYPEYWEYCKLLAGLDDGHGWCSEGWAGKVMRPFENEYEAYAEYISWRGYP